MKSKTSNSKILNQIRSYAIAGKLLHMITLVEIGLVFLILPIFSMNAGDPIFIKALKWFGIFYLVCLPIFAQLDARSRYQNYKQIKDQIYLYGYNERILKPILKSRCQRDAAWLSAKELGLGNRCKSFFSSKGYRWYHIFPDFVFSKPQFMLSPYFWKTTFFTPKYNSKINYFGLEIVDTIPDVAENLNFDAS